tara:strand:+ start:2572 stop:3234 length:663 start_codon:yes stop_codon:yes gene_type:complete
MNKYYDVKVSVGLYNQAMYNSNKIFDNNNNCLQNTHWIQIFDKDIMEILEKKYSIYFLNTMSYKNQNIEKEKEKYIIATNCLFYNYLIYLKNYDLKDPNNIKIYVIHTNNYTNENNTNENRILFKTGLKKSLNSWLLNAQGNGISDEYPNCDWVHNIFYSFLEEIFPEKTLCEKDIYENYYINTNNNILYYSNNCIISNKKLIIIFIIILMLFIYKKYYD